MPVTTGSVDGVDAFWTDSGRERLSASLIFRVGAADETLATAGSSHLIEHLLLHGPPSGAVEVNGSTSGLLVSLDAVGSPEAVADHLRRVCARVAHFPLGEVDHERRVLAAERAGRPTGATSRALTIRYGATGPGLLAWSDFAVESLAVDHLQRWLSAHFTAGNAALALDGPPPAGLTLPLPPGPRRPTTRPTPRTLPIPVAHEVLGDALLVTGLVPRSPAMVAALNIWRRRVRRALVSVLGPRAEGRGLRGRGPDESADHLIWAGEFPDGATPRELADEVRLERLQSTTSDATRAEAWIQARQGLVGAVGGDADTLIAGLETVTPAAVAAALDEVRRTLLVQVPPGTDRSGEPDLTWTPTNDPAADTVTTRFRLAGPRGLLRAAPVMRLGDRTLTRSGPLESFTVSLRDLAAATFRADGTAVLINQNGEGLTVWPSLWHRGDQLSELLRQRIPAEVVLTRESSSTDESPTPATWGDLYTRAVHRLTRRPSTGP